MICCRRKQMNHSQFCPSHQAFFIQSKNIRHIEMSYRNLIEARNAELSIQNADRESLSSLFEKYSLVNNELFRLDDAKRVSEYTEGAGRNMYNSCVLKKNYKMFYLEYYYSILLDNEDRLPYPKFLFFNDRIRQHFGGFRFAIARKDISNYAEKNPSEISNDNNTGVFYKSDVFNNEIDLECSCTLFSILENKSSKANAKSFKVVAHQLNDDKEIELPKTGEKISVSFPVEILVYKEGNGDENLEESEAFILSFSPSKEHQINYFINNYDELQNEFEQFISLSEHDNELSSIISKQTESVAEEESSVEDKDEDEDFSDSIENETSYSSSYEEDHHDVKSKIKRKDFKLYELQKIPTKSTFQLPSLNVKESVLSLRCWLLSMYNLLAERIMIYYTISDSYGTQNETWMISLPSSSFRLQNLYDQQIIRPCNAMNTKLKFNLINKILTNERRGEPKIRLVINRFEQQRFFEQFDPKSSEKTKSSARPMIVQMMEQVDSYSLPLLKVHRQNPFTIELVGEGAIDASGPGREVFSSLIVELMNEHIGIFTFNPNRNHKTKDTNQEDLIPNTHYKGSIYNGLESKHYYDASSLSSRFIYAGALIAVCIVSELPQQMKLANFVWEYLSHEKISIESIYEIDNDFKGVMKKAESLLKQIKESPSSLSDKEFESEFMQTFEIKDSFDEVVPLVDDGNRKRVTKENLEKFIELAKNRRIHEFDYALKLLKKGFDMIMSYKSITSILTPSELKLFICGEPNCSVEQMKQLTVVGSTDEKMTKMFWNVMESFSIEERILFIKFSTGTQGLPAPGTKWESDLKVVIGTKEDFLKNGKKLPEAHTCFSEIDIPYFESEEELAKNLRVSINYSGMISDINRIPDGMEQLV